MGKAGIMHDRYNRGTGQSLEIKKFAHETRFIQLPNGPGLVAN